MQRHEPLARKPKRSLMMLCVVGVAIVSAGCSQTIAGTAEQLCQQWRIVTVSKAEIKALSAETKRSIAGNNAARETWCKGAV
jgi:hypothetical protein